MAHSNLVDVVIPADCGNYTAGRNTGITDITIHHMAGVLSAEQCGAIFARAGRNGSAHYGIGNDGRVGCYVEEENTAWTNSNWASNCRSVTIETSNSETGGDWPVSDVAFDKLVKLVADIAKRNGLGNLEAGRNLTWHSMFSSTTCPGDYLRERMGRIAELANEINSGSPAPAPAPAPAPSKKSNDEIADEVIKGVWGNNPERRQRLEEAGYDYNSIQAIVNDRLSPSPAPVGKSNEEIADEVIRGDWGNNPERKQRLEEAGYDYNAIQGIVNQRLGGGSAPAQDGGLKVGDTVVPTNLVDYYGTRLAQYNDTYTIVELNGDRAVLATDGAVWAAMNVNNIRKV